MAHEEPATGDGGVLALRETVNNPALKRQARGFIDDDPSKQGTMIQGLAVFGGYARLPDVIERESIDEVVVASSKISPARLLDVTATCKDHGISLVRASLRLE